MRGNLRSNTLSLLVCVLILIAVDVYLIPNDFAFMEIRPNPYLVLSIIFASLYGLSMSFIASLLTGGAYLVSVHMNLNYEEVESLIDMAYLSTPISILALSVILGELSDRRQRRIRSLQKELSDLGKMEELTRKKTSEQGKEITELRKRLVSRLDTTRSLFETARSFHSLEEEELLANLKLALQKLYKTSAVELIDVSETRIPELGSLSRKAIRLRQQVTLVDLLKEKDLAGSVSLALPIILDEEVEYLVEVSEIPFLEYIPSNFRISEIYGQWIASSLGFGRRYRRSERQSIWNEELKVHRYHYFEERIGEEFSRSRTYMLPLSILRVKLTHDEGVPPSKFFVIQKLFTGVASRGIRKLDFISEGSSPGEFLVVMPVSDRSKALEVWGPIEAEFSRIGLSQLSGKLVEWNPEMERLEDLLSEVQG